MYGSGSRSSGAAFNAVANGDASVFQKIVSSGSSNETVTVNVTAGTGVFPVTTGNAALITGPDNFFLNWVNPGAGYNLTYGRALNAPTIGKLGYSLTAANSSGAVNTGATAMISLNTPIEGMNLTHLMYQPATLSFDVYSPVAGRHYATLYAGATGQPGGGPAFVIPYDVLFANSWQRITAALDLGSGSGFLTTAAAAMGTDRALTIHWPLMIGSNFFTSTFNSWIATGTSALGGSDTPNLAANAAAFNVTNIAIMPGNQSTFPQEDTATMLARCMRLFWCSTAPSGGAFADVPARYFCRVAGAFNESLILPFPVGMRIAPAIRSVNATGTLGNWRNATAGADSGLFTVNGVTPNYAVLVNPQAAGDAQGDQIQTSFIVDARM